MTDKDLENTNSFILVMREAVKWGLTCEVLTDMCRELNITTEELAVKANGAAMEWDIQEVNMKYTLAQVAQAAMFGWDINIETGEWSSNCTVCRKYAVIDDAGGACNECVDKFRREREVA